MKNALVTITTDFGDDFALAQLKAVLLTQNPQVEFITISNQTNKFSILEGAFIVANACNLFPQGTIHLGIIDPGVGSNRQGVVIQTDDYFFVGPNNGLFAPAIKDKKFELFKINEQLVNKNHSSTFHGRDIFAKVAGLLSKGSYPLDFCTPLKTSAFVWLKFKHNQLLHIDPYGNLKINISMSRTNRSGLIILNYFSLSENLPQRS